MPNVRGCGGMADASDSKSDGLITRAGSSPAIRIPRDFVPGFYFAQNSEFQHSRNEIHVVSVLPFVPVTVPAYSPPTISLYSSIPYPVIPGSPLVK